MVDIDVFLVTWGNCHLSLDKILISFSFFFEPRKNITKDIAFSRDNSKSYNML
jgi:hypothetical protein